MPISQREAAKRWGMSRATIQRHIKAGKLSASRDDAGRHVLDPAEMQRLYGPPKLDSIAPLDTPIESAELVVLKAENGYLKTLLAEKDAHIEDLRQALRLGHDKPAPSRRWWPWDKA